MSKIKHRLHLLFYTAIVIATLVIIVIEGMGYYQTSLEERFFHENHQAFKPSGAIGHGLGIIGSLLMMIGVFVYMARKRWRSLSRIGVLKYWLEFHIFMCTLGPILVLFHTAFKFGGIVSISFWSMVAVFASGIIGRFIYLQIPRSIEGRMLSLYEVRQLRQDLSDKLLETLGEKNDMLQHILEARQESNTSEKPTSTSRSAERKTVRAVKRMLAEKSIDKKHQREIVHLLRNDFALEHRIKRLALMQNLFKYWHVAHLPFAILMLVIMLIHVGVTLTFGYRWIF
jgi:hypothetical protein